MKGMICAITIILIFFSTSLNAQLSGNYTIGSGGDYKSFMEAVDSLQSQGISSEVTFNVLTGIYREQILIPAIFGVNASNTITFQSQTGIPDDVVLYDSTTVDTNFIVKIDEADFIRFKNITFETTSPDYGRIFQINGDTDHLELSGNVFNGNNNKNSGAFIFAEGSDCDSILITGNIFNQGGSCLNISGDYTNHPSNIRIINNTLNKMWYGLTLHNVIAPKIIGNTIETPYYIGTGHSGLYLTGCEGALEISKNRINHYNGYGVTIAGFNGTSSEWGLIANNFISSSTTTASSWVMTISNSHYMKIFNNTLISQFGWYVFTLSSGGYGGSHFQIMNNNFIHMGDGTAYNMQLYPAVENSDYNNFYSGGHNLANWHHTYTGGTSCYDLDSLQRCSGMDLHSHEVFPMFADPAQPYIKHPWLDGAGTPLTEITEDIDGNPRDPEHPDIGCCEFSTNPLSSPYSGDLTIGSGGDFTGFSEALDSLLLRGISGSVQINVLPGIYNEQLKIRSIPGASMQDSIVFQSQSGNPEDVTLHYTPPNDTSYVVQFFGADHICFKGMTLFGDTTGATANYYIFRGEGRVDNIQIKNNVLAGTKSANTTRPLIQFTGSTGYGRIISGNTFLLNKNIGIEFNDTFNSDIEILNNSFDGGNLAITIHEAEGLIIEGNRINSGGIDIYGCTAPLRILENTIYLRGARCIRVRGTSGSSEERGMIANNFLRQAGGGYYHYGIGIENSGFLDICFNSISITSTDVTRGRALSVQGIDSKNLSIINNILCNSGGGCAYYVDNVADVNSSDHNDIYSTGTQLAVWHGVGAPDLDSLRMLSNLDLNSVSADPGFISASNLHANSPAIDSMAIPIEGILVDIDGELRDLTHPDIGADEFIPGFNYVPVITSEPDTVAFTDSLYSYQVTATDHNADTLTFYLQNAPDWIQINDSTGLVSGIPSYEDAGDTTIIILVNDGHGGTATQVYPLHVIQTTGLVNEHIYIPKSYALYQNYPNPFNPSTTIKFQIPNSQFTTLKVYDILGREVSTLVSKKLNQGDHTYTFDGKNLASGIYYYQIVAGEYREVKKMILLR